jgi:hypothetical protein
LIYPLILNHNTMTFSESFQDSPPAGSTSDRVFRDPVWRMYAKLFAIRACQRLLKKDQLVKKKGLSTVHTIISIVEIGDSSKTNFES